MLIELTIKNFAIIETLQLQFQPGFNVLTGETGAGKSIIIDAVNLLLGGRADINLIRSGADTAWVEGNFKLTPDLQTELAPILEREALHDEDNPDDYLTLARELRHSGRNVCRVNGRTVSLGILRELSAPLVDVHGQTEHLSLLNVRQHVRLLDHYADLSTQRAEFAALVTQLNTVRRDLRTLIQNERDAARRVDTLTYQIEEIEVAGLSPDEEQVLRDERVRLANAEKLARLVGQAISAAAEGDTDGESGLQQPAAGDLLGQMVAAIDNLARVDGSLQPQLELVNALVGQLDDLTRDLYNYRDSIEFNPRRLNEVEERLMLLHALQRKYGDSIEAVLAYATRARAELDDITHAEERIAELQQAEADLLHRLGVAGEALSAARHEAGATLASGIEAELTDLRMDGARFEVELRCEDDSDGAVLAGGRRVRFDATGIDRVEFLVAPNPGEGFKPLVKIASGGETARLMLALKGVLARADRTPTLIFDEIDQGIGGRIGAIVGQKLWRLSGSHQVLCITHLPQLAGYGDVHFKVEKAIDHERTITTIHPLTGDARIDELAQMLGTGGDATRQSAEALLSEVAVEKARPVRY